MAFRMKRSAPNDDKPEPMRKRRKLNTLFDLNDVEALSKRAEISASKSLTADERRIEIGKRLLAATKESIPHSDDDDNDESDAEAAQTSAIHKKLMSKIGELEGKSRFRIAKKLRDYISSHKDLDCKIASFRGHRLSVTCMALDPSGNDRYAITGSKDGSIIKWDLKKGKRVRKVWHAWPLNKRKRNSNERRKNGKKVRFGGLRYEVFKKIRPKPVLAVAISPDEKWLVSGGEDSLIRVWNIKTMRYKSTFRGGHKGKVTGLAFSKNKADTSDSIDNNTLFSTGSDRQIRVYDMNEMGFAEPLYGHTLAINNIDTTSEDRCVTVSDDKTIRYWKLRTQSQLIFNNGHNESIDACCILTPGRFVTGSQDGSIALWSTAKKHPLHKQLNVHLKHWIVSLSAKHNADVFATGSSDGICKLFIVKNNTFTHLRSIKIPKGGFINVIKWSEKGDKIICGIGTEHRLGRWQHVNGAKNGIAIIKLPVKFNDDSDDDDDDDDVEYLMADNWDKWNPKERGKHIDKSKEKDENVKASVNDDDNDKDDIDKEWTSFFGNVFE